MKKNLKDKKSLNIAMLGHKRIPSREGGIEIVVEELATRMVTLGHKVTCYNRSGHHVSGKDFDGGKRKAYKGVRLKSVLTLDEELSEGFPILLEKAYAGNISLDDYINFIKNCCEARQMKILLPYIDWDQIYGGITIQIGKLIDSEDESYLKNRSFISDENEYKNNLLPEEQRVYKKIEEAIIGNSVMFEKNRKLYLRLMRNDPATVFTQMNNKRMDRFDIEMAEATAYGFEKIPNKERIYFSDYFNEIFRRNISFRDFKLENWHEGFIKLRDRLKQFKEECKRKSQWITIVHIDRFMKVVSGFMTSIYKARRTALVIMAAGIGSRFGGGIKQLAPVGLNGEIIMDYSIHGKMKNVNRGQYNGVRNKYLLSFKGL